jgi:low molecular weight protein-tyrosine phosphatase
MGAILVVCTGNVCRSPIAEGLLREALWARLGDRAPEVSSAGVAGWEGSGAAPESIAAAAERGIDISTHVARRLVPRQILEADLVLGMAREHRDAVGRMVVDAGARTFTLKELVRLLEALPEPVRSEDADADAALASRVRDADALRRSGSAGNPHDEDVVDPLGLPPATYRAVAWELDGWCSRLADGLFGKAAATSPVGWGEA